MRKLHGMRDGFLLVLSEGTHRMSTVEAISLGALGMLIASLIALLGLTALGAPLAAVCALAASPYQTQPQRDLVALSAGLLVGCWLGLAGVAVVSLIAAIVAIVVCAILSAREWLA